VGACVDCNERVFIKQSEGVRRPAVDCIAWLGLIGANCNKAVRSRGLDGKTKLLESDADGI